MFLVSYLATMTTYIDVMFKFLIIFVNHDYPAWWPAGILVIMFICSQNLMVYALSYYLLVAQSKITRYIHFFKEESFFLHELFFLCIIVVLIIGIVRVLFNSELRNSVSWRVFKLQLARILIVILLNGYIWAVLTFSTEEWWALNDSVEASLVVSVGILLILRHFKWKKSSILMLVALQFVFMFWVFFSTTGIKSPLNIHSLTIWKVQFIIVLLLVFSYKAKNISYKTICNPKKPKLLKVARYYYCNVIGLIILLTCFFPSLENYSMHETANILFYDTVFIVMVTGVYMFIVSKHSFCALLLIVILCNLFFKTNFVFYVYCLYITFIRLHKVVHFVALNSIIFVFYWLQILNNTVDIFNIICVALTLFLIFLSVLPRQ